jgi:peptidoglycan-associated lipoprotein
MRFRSYIFPAVITAVVLAACSSNDPPAETPGPSGPTAEELEAQRVADSIAAAEAAAEAERLRSAEAARRAEAERDRLIGILEQRVFFEFDQSRLTAAAESALRQKLDILRDFSGVELRLEGHADERGSTEYNLALGNRRAQSVVDFFAGFGLSDTRFSTVSFGEERPLVPESTEAAWSQNRRVEFVITTGRDQIQPGGVSQ